MADNKDDKGQNAREFFRIHYTAPDNPILEMDKVKFFVIDISEGGLKFTPKKGQIFAAGQRISGKILFGSRGFYMIKGSILRVSIRDIAVQLDEPSRIPLTRIMEEQRFLIQKGKM
ncbi:MAG: PilZ domain-containing protein [Proteobacteria bacterium]|nr:MAG: PilZ domain-containing protein [Pseudomonadota bacterium]